MKFPIFTKDKTKKTLKIFCIWWLTCWLIYCIIGCILLGATVHGATFKEILYFFIKLDITPLFFCASAILLNKVFKKSKILYLLLFIIIIAILFTISLPINFMFGYIFAILFFVINLCLIFFFIPDKTRNILKILYICWLTFWAAVGINAEETWYDITFWDVMVAFIMLSIIPPFLHALPVNKIWKALYVCWLIFSVVVCSFIGAMAHGATYMGVLVAMLIFAAVPFFPYLSAILLAKAFRKSKILFLLLLIIALAIDSIVYFSLGIEFFVPLLVIHISMILAMIKDYERKDTA